MGGKSHWMLSQMGAANTEASSMRSADVDDQTTNRACLVGRKSDGRPVDLIAHCDDGSEISEEDGATIRRWLDHGGILVMPPGITLYQTIDGKITKVFPA